MKGMLSAIFIGTFVFVVTCNDIWAQATAQISGTARDQSAAVLPGVEIRATQTETGTVRETITNETGSYVMPNLPIGPYRLEAALPGFRTYVQTGIVLQVNGSPTINVVLEVGQVSEQIEVQANATLVETRTVGVGQVVENARILELPLNGRAMIELVALSGAATPAEKIDGSGGRDPFSKGNISVAGGQNTGLNYTLDGAFHNNPFDSSYQSMPFPDALQEFKVETGGTGAQNGVKPSGSVSLVTKSGTNELHGNVFEFVRNGIFNARNAFAERRDTIKRNQFGGTLGGAIMRSKLFFFAGYQGTTLREDPAQIIQYVPTKEILAGDFTAFASPQCNAGRPMTLRAPFVNNRIDPALFSKAAVALSSKLPASSDPCGKVIFGMPRPTNEHMAIGRIDYQPGINHTVFGRYLLENTKTRDPYSITKILLAVNNLGTGNRGRSQAFTLGDTYLFGSNIVNALRLTANRIYGAKFMPDKSAANAGTPALGIKAYNPYPDLVRVAVTGAFQVWCGGCGSGSTATAIFAVNDDLSVIRGDHQLTMGGQTAVWWVNSYSDTYTHMPFTFNGQTTGMGIGDFLLGAASQLEMGTRGDQNKRSNYLGLYGADTWKVNRKLTFNYGLRWEPYFPMVHLDGSVVRLDMDAMRKGIKSTRFKNTPPGVFFIGDPGWQGGSRGAYIKWLNFSPRLGFAWDAAGDGRTSVRASVGMFYDFPSTGTLRGFSNGAPWLSRYLRQNVKFDDPWADEPGGDPFPRPNGRAVGPDASWPAYAYVIGMQPDLANMRVTQFNLALQKQAGTDWLVSASYIGNLTRHMWSIELANSAVFLGLDPCTLNGVRVPSCSTTGNTNQRRMWSIENPQNQTNIGPVQRIDPGATASYNGMILSVERRPARGISLGANYTWSHCISDPAVGAAVDSTTSGWTNPYSRRFDRGNCSSDRRHVLNVTSVASTPGFSNKALRTIASGWRFSPIFRVLSGSALSVTTNQDRALSGIGSQRVNQILVNPYGDKTATNYLNPAAFALPAMGTLGNVGANSIFGPKTWQFDASLSRTFQLREAQRLELRAEAFNVTNAFRMDEVTTNLNSNTFGQVTSAKDPRIMQFVLKYAF